MWKCGWVFVIYWLMVGNAWGQLPQPEPIPFKVNAQSAIVVDATTNEVVVDKNANVVRPIASITKVMTAMVTLDAALPMDEEITITDADVKSTAVRGQISGGSLPVGTKLTREEVLHLALMNSHNRAAASLARTYPGGTLAFVAAMNNKAKDLGLTHTTFVDPTGLYSSNVSTAQELAVMVRHAATYPDIQRLSTATELDTKVQGKRSERPAHFGTTNRLLVTPNWNIDLQKTGYIRAAGRCLVMMTMIGSKPFIVVLLNAPSPYHRGADAVKIKAWLETGTVVTRAQLATLNPYKMTHKKKRKKVHTKRIRR